MAEHPSCSICNNVIPPSPEGSITTGYGIIPGTDKKVCYPCCAERDKQQMRDTGKITLYLTVIEPDPNVLGTRLLPPRYACKITNWPSSLVLQGGCRKGKHNIARTRYDVWFNFEGYEWWGVSYGEDAQLVHCKRTKQKV